MPPTSVTRRGTIQMALAMTIAGSIGVFVVESGYPSIIVASFRCLIGALALAIYCWARGHFRRPNWGVRSMILIAVAGALLTANWVLLFDSFSLTSISIATIAYHVNPFIILALGAIFFGDTLDPSKIIWTITAFAGPVLVIGVPDHLVGECMLGIAFALFATTLFSFTIVITKSLMTVPPDVIALIQVVVGGILLLPLARPWEVVLTSPGWLYLVGLGIIHTGLLYALLYAAFQNLSKTMIAILSFIYPVVTVLLDGIIYGRVLVAEQWLGITAIAVATLGVMLGWAIYPNRKGTIR